ncbi:hypothetical protein [Paenibacillus sp. J22TS3]|uniref:hypothetical protein n=1 Tax=Paenibacillus sp. J22TS3 TaxID=2807192 RepID=UPI001AFDECD1|nr:hypothetical protein [Paenibacillus sp. J22TS3]GIP20308.1 hypothetical protein J22TS3_05830 [Paenibacillus sp. J22TS3]
MKPVPYRTEEEADWVKEHVLLPLILDLMERDLRLISSDASPFKLPELYADVLRKLQARITRELAQIRQQMRQHGIKVYEQHRTRAGLEAKYLCRGYQYEFSMLWGFAKAEIDRRVIFYLEEVAFK